MGVHNNNFVLFWTITLLFWNHSAMFMVHLIRRYLQCVHVYHVYIVHNTWLSRHITIDMLNYMTRHKTQQHAVYKCHKQAHSGLSRYVSWSLYRVSQNYSSLHSSIFQNFFSETKWGYIRPKNIFSYFPSTSILSFIIEQRWQRGQGEIYNPFG